MGVMIEIPGGMWVLFARVTPLGSWIYDFVSPDVICASDMTEVPDAVTLG
jgi:hypothetical protein